MSDPLGISEAAPLGTPRMRSYDRWLLAKLKDPEVARLYLNEHFSDDGGGDFEKLQLLALERVAASKGYRLVKIDASARTDPASEEPA